LIVVPSTVTARIQEMHIMIGHALCKLLEYRLSLV
jgi:D-sedoheptulose 7-phosphate isomerase